MESQLPCKAELQLLLEPSGIPTHTVVLGYCQSHLLPPW